MTARKLQFAGALFDGKSARKHIVDVELTPREIIIKKPGQEPLHWFYPNLRWAAKTTHPFHIEHGDINSEYLETLVVEDPAFYENVSRIAPDSFCSSRKQTEINWKIYIAGILILFLSAYVFAKAVPTFLADRMIDKIPVEWEVTLGQSILKMLPLEKNPDQKILAVLQDTVDFLEQSVEGKQPYDLRVYIWSEKDVNALALPGGTMLVSQGLLNEAESPEELAGVLAHEIQHILLRHSTRGILRNLAQSMLVALIVGDVNSTMDKVVNLASTLETLGLSREMEAEADRKGMELILAANIDPNGMIRVYEKLEKSSQEEEINQQENSDIKLFSYFSTHPSSRNRLSSLKKQIKSHENRTWEPLFPNRNWNEIKPKN